MSVSTNILRLYDPPECGPLTERGAVPLDWDRCRNCGGKGEIAKNEGDPLRRYACGRCGGHGSLRAAALAALMAEPPEAAAVRMATERYNRNPSPWASRNLGDAEHRLRQVRWVREARCEGCGHPMNDGTWEGDDRRDVALRQGDADHVLACLRGGREPTAGELGSVHWSPCDEGCRHGGPGREWHEVAVGDDPWGPVDDVARVALSYPREALWRSVDVRTLGWAHDLRPEKLAVLCLRCLADRTAKVTAC